MSDLIRNHYHWTVRMRWIQLVFNAACACVHFALGQYVLIPIQLFFSVYVFIMMGTRLVDLAVEQLFDPDALIPNVTGKRQGAYLVAVRDRLRSEKLEPTIEALEHHLHFWIAKAAVMKLKNEHTTSPREYATCIEKTKLYPRLIEHLRSTSINPPA